MEQQEVIDEALEACWQLKLFRATDFTDMVQYLERQRSIYMTKTVKQCNTAKKPVDYQSESILQISAEQRDINEYLAVLGAENNE